MAVITGDDVEFETLAGPSPPGALGPCQSSMWRLAITDLESDTITILDKLASDRHVQTLLGAPNWQSFVVPSDSTLVNTLVGAEDPYVSEGNRLAYWFRKEANEAPFFECRAAGTLMQAEDTAEQDNARSKFVSFDTWGLAARRPACDDNGDLPVPFGDIDGAGIGWDGIYAPGTTVGEIIVSQFENSEANMGSLRCILGTIEDTVRWDDAADPQEYVVQGGMSVADVWTAMVSTNKCDLVFTPLYDPLGNPGVTHTLNVYVQAGVDLPDQMFGWDRPPHSLVSLSRMIDGTQRANNVILGAGVGAQYGVTEIASDAASIVKYGQYWAQQTLPGTLARVGLQKLADFQLSLRKNGRTTIQMSPAPERSPCPFQEYNVGDRVPVYASREKFRQELVGYVRIYGFPIDISDDALERVQGMILLPQGIL